MFRKNKIGISGLLETKLRGNKIDEFMGHRFPNWDYFSSPNTEGRLLILWRKGIAKVSILEDSSQLVHYQVKLIGLQNIFFVSFVYGFNSVHSRRSLCCDLAPISLTVKAWLVLGDFNAPFPGDDRSGGCSISSVELVDPIGWKTTTKMEAIKSTGSYFAWTNNQEGSARIFSKIDHALINEEWLDKFPNCLAVFNWDVVSDHCSFIVFIIPLETIGTKLFRFYNFWASHPEFIQVVLNSWRVPVYATGLKAIFTRLICLKHKLRQLNRDRFGDIVKEIKVALFSIPRSKLPGPDGYGSCFFKSVWKHIGQDICVTITHGFTTDQFPQELHETSLSLIPKVPSPARASDYRPIACCSTLYKVIAELLCSRLSVVLPQIIQVNQGAFVRGRSIAHNIMILQDLIKNYGRANTSPRCAIKIDISKAYDTVDWQFLENLLKAYCFPSKFIGWVMKCVRSSSYSLQINGRVQCKFKGGKGLRQGDPMSPLPFVLIMEYMTRCLQLGANSSAFQFHPLCKSLKLVNLCFADDVILFCKGSVLAVSVLKASLKEFSDASGLTINSKKLLLIQTVLFVLRNYWMSVFTLPQSIIKEVEKLCRQFLWGALGTRSKLHLASWHQVCLPKAYGGLGLRDGASWNRALLARYVWAVSTKLDSLWVKWIQHIYLKGANFWEYELKQDSSWYWRKLCHLRKRFNEQEILAAGSSGIFKPAMLCDLPDLEE
ncbi:uncharacterized protein LOC133806204 [Humulus lupulus]|uniref:uncharacterized protein LOC133806204 n=1 Tax=Humulus lupulus TaxID=3486 RepID=UPI002B40E71C|nr:uncharacterized protein LOC133806204 [Humulus lupulus]